MKSVKIAVFVSGGGSNLRSLWQASQHVYTSYCISAVAADQHCAALEFAQTQGIFTTILEADDRIIARKNGKKILENHLLRNIDMIVLAGFMRLVRPDFLHTWPKAIINIHPSLLPLYPGLDTHSRALAAGDGTAGCTVHHVDAGIDTGAIIAQAECPIMAHDTPQKLAQRVLTLEHLLYPLCVDHLARHQSLPQRVFDLNTLQTIIGAA